MFKQIYTVVCEDSLIDSIVDVVSFSTEERAKQEMKKYYNQFCNENNVYFKYIDDRIGICHYKEDNGSNASGRFTVEVLPSYIME